MVAQWENECISLCVLSVTLVMIAQWENECISLSVLSVTLVMIAQWENECISLSVFSMAWVKFPAMVKYFKGFSPADHMCFLVHSSKRSGVPLEKCLQSHEDHEVPTDQPGIRATKN